MSASLGSLKAYLSADVTGWVGGLNKALSSLSAFKVAAIGGMAAAAGAVTALGIKGTKEFYRQDRQIKRIGALLKASDSISGMTTKAIAEDAAKMSRAFGMTEEDVMKLQARMLSFPNIGKQMLGRATAGAINMAAGLGKDQLSMVTALARALQDPLRGIMLLKRHIGTFTSGETEAIRNALMLGDVFKAQEVIMAKVEARFNGVRDAMVTPWERIQAAWPEVLEGIGKIVVATLDLDKAGRSVGETFAGWGKDMQQMAMGFGVAIKMMWQRLVLFKDYFVNVTGWIGGVVYGWGIYILGKIGQGLTTFVTNIKRSIENLGQYIYVTLVNTFREVRRVAAIVTYGLPGLAISDPEGPDLKYTPQKMRKWTFGDNDLAEQWRKQIPWFKELGDALTESTLKYEKAVAALEGAALSSLNAQQKRDIAEQNAARGKSGANVVANWEKLYDLPRGLFKQFKDEPLPEFAQLAEKGSVEAYRLMYGRNDEMIEMTEQIVTNTEAIAEAAETMADIMEDEQANYPGEGGGLDVD